MVILLTTFKSNHLEYISIAWQIHLPKITILKFYVHYKCIFKTTEHILDKLPEMCLLLYLNVFD